MGLEAIAIRFMSCVQLTRSTWPARRGTRGKVGRHGVVLGVAQST